MVYSKINDSVCCLPCLLFYKNKKKLEQLPECSKWHNVGDKLKYHFNNGTYSTAITVASGFKDRFEKPSLIVTYGYDNQRIKRVQHNRKIMKWVKKNKENNTSYLAGIVKKFFPMRTIAANFLAI